ncbi:hypothetical protein Acr_29g0006850 [Actinidia rufa]|uniref:Uncharacterized protein n=1 Tax=Actinidia rufa TaxID=165716 RepID=A0A7J0HEJ6_9ERIC|nr:hypothetical protein Acr_29g0006850 [Actinidia rufa]
MGSTSALTTSLIYISTTPTIIPCSNVSIRPEINLRLCNSTGESPSTVLPQREEGAKNSSVSLALLLTTN